MIGFRETLTLFPEEQEWNGKRGASFRNGPESSGTKCSSGPESARGVKVGTTF